MLTQSRLAISIIIKSFKDKKDLAGEPYVNHLDRVASSFEDDELISISLLHDLVEDCPEWTIDMLREKFSKRVCDAVEVLTKKKNEPYAYYIKRVSTNPDAVKVKLSDLRDNMDIKRFNRDLTDKDIQRILKYHKAYLQLSNL